MLKSDTPDGDSAGSAPDSTMPPYGMSLIYNIRGELFFLEPKKGDLWIPPAMVVKNKALPFAELYQLATKVTGLALDPLGHLPPFMLPNGVECSAAVFLATADHKGQNQDEPMPAGAVAGEWVPNDQLEERNDVFPSVGVIRAAFKMLMDPIVDFQRAETRPETLSPSDLIETDYWLHVLGKTQTAVHEVIREELEKRGITHKDETTALEKADYRTAEVDAGMQNLPGEFVIVPEWISVSGGQVYAQNREPNDVDLVIREPFPPQGALLKVQRAAGASFQKPPHVSFDAGGPSWPYVPVYDLVARRREHAQVREMGEPDFEQFYKADLPTDPEDFRLGYPFAHYKAGGEFYPGEEAALWRKLQATTATQPIYIAQEKFDGMRLHIHKQGNALKIFTETGRERSSVFPGLIKALDGINAKAFAFDCEFVQWEPEFKAPLPRWGMTWMIVGKEAPPDVWVKINVHDVMWLGPDGVEGHGSMTEVPYTKRLAAIQELLPKEIRNGHYLIAPVDSKAIDSQRSFVEALDWARRRPGSEGAMIKSAEMKYDGGVHHDIFKFKNVIELDVAAIGFKKNPLPKPAGTHWTEAQAKAALPGLLKDSKTYIFRVALASHGKLVPLESDKKLSQKDLELHWDEKNQKWQGTDDPALWTMWGGFPQRQAGEYAYANTYAIALDDPPYFKLVLTVSPMQFRAFKKEDGSTGYAWMFPKVRNTKPRGSAVGDLSRTLEAFGAKGQAGKPLAQHGDSRLTKSQEENRTGIMVCLPVPPWQAQKILNQAEDGLPDGSDQLEAGELHITLAFCGNTDEVAFSLESLKEAVRSFAQKHLPVKGTISGVGTFNNNPEEFPVYASYDSPELPRFRQDLVEALDASGIEYKTDHGFSPHITIAYLKAGQPAENVTLEQMPLAFEQVAVAWGGEWTYWNLGSGEESRPLFKRADPYIEPPTEDREYRYVVQHHYRGKSVHADLRIEHGGFLIGWTVMDGIADEIKEPVVTLAEAKNEDRQTENFKLNWETGEIKPRRIRGGIVRRGDLRVAEKAKEIPQDWLHVQGVTDRTEPGEKPSAGSTRNYPGVFSIIDQGKVEYGAQKPWFHEYFMDGRRLKGRWVVRLIANAVLHKNWDHGVYLRELKAIDRNKAGAKAQGPHEFKRARFPLVTGKARCLICGQPKPKDGKCLGLKQVRKMIAGARLTQAGELIEKQDGVLPEGKLDPSPRAGYYWVLIQPDDQQPYVLSNEAIKKKWLPPKEISALPKRIRKSVPESLQYWKMSGEAALKAREDLSKNYEELGGPKIKR